jgi:hypothetical protein
VEWTASKVRTIYRYEPVMTPKIEPVIKPAMKPVIKPVMEQEFGL